MRILFSRDQDGGEVVHPLEDGTFQVQTREGEIKTFPSKRKLLIDLTRHPTARNWTFDRYFYLGKHTPTMSLPTDQGPITVLEVLGTLPEAPMVMIPKPPLGIDLKTRGGEVAKLLFAGFGRTIAVCGYDPEDVLQEIFKAILVRNRGKCPWDVQKSSFGHYVHMICQCELANYHRRMNRRKQVEQIGMMGSDKDSPHTMMDVGQALSTLDVPAMTVESPSDRDSLVIQKLIQQLKQSKQSNKPDTQLACQLIPLLAQGYSQGEILEHLGISKNLFNRALVLLRKTAIRLKLSIY